MKESYGEGVATHTDPESFGAARKDGVEALTGAHAGQERTGRSRSAGCTSPGTGRDAASTRRWMRSMRDC